MKKALISAVLFATALSANGAVNVTASRDYVDSKVSSLSNDFSVIVSNLNERIDNATPGEYMTVSNRAMNSILLSEAKSGWTDWEVDGSFLDLVPSGWYIDEVPDYWHLNVSGGDHYMPYSQDCTNLVFETYKVSVAGIEMSPSFSRVRLPTYADIDNLDKKIDMQRHDLTNDVDSIVTRTEYKWVCRYGDMERIQQEEGLGASYYGLKDFGGFLLYINGSFASIDSYAGEVYVESSNVSEDTIVFDFSQEQMGFYAFGTLTFKRVIVNSDGLARMMDVNDRTKIVEVYGGTKEYSDRWRIYRTYDGHTLDVTDIAAQPSWDASEGYWNVYELPFEEADQVRAGSSPSDTNLTWTAAFNAGSSVYNAFRIRKDVTGYTLKGQEDMTIVTRPLTGKVYDFSTLSGMYIAVSNIVDALGGSITNFPAISQ